MNKQSGRQAGFTITETIIVLAIAGLILLVVLLAIPALERSSRNNQRRQDAQTILADVSHYELNNSGSMPQNSSFLTGSTLTYYTNSVTYRNLAAQACPAPSGSRIYLCIAANWDDPNLPTTTPANTDLDAIVIYNHQKCSGTTGTSTRNGAGFSDVVALYAIEDGHNIAPQCQQL